MACCCLPCSARAHCLNWSTAIPTGSPTSNICPTSWTQARACRLCALVCQCWMSKRCAWATAMPIPCGPMCWASARVYAHWMSHRKTLGAKKPTPNSLKAYTSCHWKSSMGKCGSREHPIPNETMGCARFRWNH